MDDLRATALQETINRCFMKKADAIEKEMIEGCKDTDSLEKICTRMVINAIRISTSLSVGLVVDTLMELGIADPADEDKSRRGILKVIK